MTLRQGILLGCTAATLVAQELPVINKVEIEMAVQEAMAAKHEVLAHKEELIAHVKANTLFAKEAMAMDKAMAAVQSQFFMQAAKGGGAPLTEDEELKLIAIDSIMQSDAERAVPIVDKIIQNQQASLRLRLRALQSMARSNSPKAREVLVRVAKDGSNIEMQSRALQLLGGRDNAQNQQLLGEVFAASSSADIKRQVLRSWASAGAKDRVLTVAKSDPNPDVREAAIRHLGQMRASTELAGLYASEQSTELREHLIRGLAQSEDWQKLLDIAKTEKNEELKSRAIQHAGNIRSAGVPEALVALYSSSADTATRSAILRGLSHQRNARQLIAVARLEKDPELKRAALQHLTRMKGDEVTSYLTELLEK